MELDGRIVGDRYRLDTLLAVGGMGQVWCARDIALDRPVAVKLLRPEYTGDELAMARFRSEAQLAAAVTHPNIAAVYDYGETWARQGGSDRFAFLVMEFVDGEPLSSVLRRERRLGPDRTLQIMRQAATGLAAAHAAGIVHRDVKPGNLLLGNDGTIKITDFGVAWSRWSDPLTVTGAILGTAEYLSPEQATGGKAGPASDVYALGMVAYECLAGRRPFEGGNPVELALMHVNHALEPLPADVSDRVQDLVAQSLAKDPEQRFPDGRALLSAVEDVLTDLAPPAQPGRNATIVLPVGDLEPGEPAAPPCSLPGKPAGPRHAASRRGWSSRVLISVLALLALGAVAAGLRLSNRDGLPAPAAGPTGTPTTPVAVRVAAGDYLGRPVGEVESELTGLGLSVQLRELRTTEPPDGAVMSVDPVGELSRGQSVTVTYTVAASAPDLAPGESTAPQIGAAITSAAPSSPTPTSATPNPASESTASRPGRDHADPHRQGPRR